MTAGPPVAPLLYSFRRCPYAMRARLALLASATQVEIREVHLSSKPAELIAASPKATVPVLVTADGRVIDESLDIMRWALARNDPEGWLDRVDADLVEANDRDFKHHLDRYKYPDRHASDPAVDRRIAIDFLSRLECRLGLHANLDGAERGFTDAALLPFVRQFAAIDPPWFARQPLPQVRAWLGRHLASPLFAAAMVKLSPWDREAAPLHFPGT